MQAIHGLAPEVREVFILFYYQNYGIEDIAAMLEVPAGTVASQLSRGRKKLKAMLEEDDHR